jgi:hypothetical protein
VQLRQLARALAAGRVGIFLGHDGEALGRLFQLALAEQADGIVELVEGGQLVLGVGALLQGVGLTLSEGASVSN